jgi:carboxymethylenebutenolidase
MAAFFAMPKGGRRAETALRAGVILLPDNRGVTPFYERLAEHLASEGHPTLAIDYFARPVGYTQTEQMDVRAVMQRVADLTRDGCHEQLRAGIRELVEHSGGAVAEVVAIGFCMGGRIAFLASQSHFGMAGVIGLYGSTEAILDAPGPTQLAPNMKAPILGIFGGADAYIPHEMVDSFEEALTRAGVSHEIVTYPGAPHSFFDVAYEEYRDICADAWQRMLGFLRTYS